VAPNRQTPPTKKKKKPSSIECIKLKNIGAVKAPYGKATPEWQKIFANHILHSSKTSEFLEARHDATQL
jgi:hypothetical protein